jgi:hypothetical protein
MSDDRWEPAHEVSKTSGLSIRLLRDLVQNGLIRERDKMGILYLSVNDLAKVIAEAHASDPKKRRA